MALSEDQRALLRLLLSGESYHGVAATLGTSADDVRERAHEAADRLERQPERDPPLREVRRCLRVLDDPEAAPAPGGHGEEDRRRRILIWLGAGAAAIAAAAVMIAVLGGGSSKKPVNSTQSEESVRIEMQPLPGARGAGAVTLVRVSDQPALQLDLRGLEPSGRGRTYVLWFVGRGDRSLPVAFQAVGRDGRLTGAVAIPSASIGLLPEFTVAELTLTNQVEAARAVRQSARTGILPQPAGTAVMRGALR